MGKVIELILHAFFPNRCIFCDKVQAFGVTICDPCLEHLNSAPQPQNVESQRYSFAVAICPFYYDMGANNAIINLKFNGAVSNARKLAEFMSYSIDDTGLLDEIDICLPVPMHIKDEKLRGYNQSALLCKELCKLINKPYTADILVKTKITEKQHLLKSKERATNLADAFSVADSDKINGKTILLVDDVFTTGTTMNMCSKALLSQGARKIICIAAAKTNYTNKID